jgi:outer membrane protein assembly factor BamB
VDRRRASLDLDAGSVRALDPETGQPRWELDAAPELVAPANGRLFTLQSDTGGLDLGLYT